MRLFCWCGLLLSALGLAARADDTPFGLKGGERIVFFGDSITQSGQYITYVDAFLLTRFPDKTFTLINHGISSETISGTSEPDHNPRRPDAHDRFARDVAAWKPDVVVACFGMNDGNYHPFDEDRFRRYQDGVRRLISRARDEAHARLILLTPPPFDPYRRQVGDPNAKSFGYKFPAVDYDDTLGRYADWLVSLRKEGFLVADVHAATNEHLRRRRDGQVSFFLAGDAVHPGPTGHWLMAQTFLQALHAPATVAEVRIDASKVRVESGEVRDVSRGGNAVRFLWHTPLPMPIDPAWDARSIALERLPDRLNRHRLVVTGLPAGRYQIEAGLIETEKVGVVGVVTDVQLTEGIDLTSFPDFPTNRLAADLLSQLQARRQAAYDAWRRSLASPGADSARDPIDESIRQQARPRDVRVEILPLPGM